MSDRFTGLEILLKKVHERFLVNVIECMVRLADHTLPDTKEKGVLVLELTGILLLEEWRRGEKCLAASDAL